MHISPSNPTLRQMPCAEDLKSRVPANQLKRRNLSLEQSGPVVEQAEQRESGSWIHIQLLCVLGKAT